MGKIIFILGGARSGKSAYALQLAKQRGKNVAFIATCQPLDKEMERRIRAHRKRRPSQWHTFEEALDLHTAVSKINCRFDCVIIDCLTLWISNLLLKKTNAPQIERKTRALLSAARKVKCTSIVIANEVGGGIVPANALARDFRDIAGRVNQICAKDSDEVYILTAGIPIKIK